METDSVGDSIAHSAVSHHMCTKQVKSFKILGTAFLFPLLFYLSQYVVNRAEGKTYDQNNNNADRLCIIFVIFVFELPFIGSRF